MGILASIVRLLGVFFAEVLPALAEELRKPRKVNYVGDDPEVKRKIEEDINRRIYKKTGGDYDDPNYEKSKIHPGDDRPFDPNG